MKVITSFYDLRDADLIPLAEQVVTRMTNNPSFTDPVVALADVSTAGDEFSKAFQKAQYGTPTDTLFKNEKRAQLEGLLNQLATYVNMKAKNNPVALSSTGFELAKERIALGPLPQPENLRLIPLSRGIKISVKALKGAASYSIEYTETPVTDQSVWKFAVSKTASTLIDGLTSGREYAFKVCGIGSHASRTYTKIQTSYIL